MGEQELRLPRQVYPLRTFGLSIGFLCIASVFFERGASPVAWGLAVAHGLVWPHVAWYRSRTSADPHRAERLNLTIDSAMGGIFVALMQFMLLPSVLFVAMLSMDKLGWGWRFLGRTSATLAVTCLATTVLTGATVQLATSMRVIVASIPLMVAYPFAIAFVTERSGRMARERRKAVEQTAALREQLAHIARVGTLGEMAAGLAHELNQPLTAIHLEAQTSLELAPPGVPSDIMDSLTRIGEQSMRAGEIVRRMRTFARRGQTRREALQENQQAVAPAGRDEYPPATQGVYSRLRDSTGSHPHPNAEILGRLEASDRAELAVGGAGAEAGHRDAGAFEFASECLRE